MITDCFKRKRDNANVVGLGRSDQQVAKSDRLKVGKVNK